MMLKMQEPCLHYSSSLAVATGAALVVITHLKFTSVDVTWDEELEQSCMSESHSGPLL